MPIQEKYQATLEVGNYYHIYNRCHSSLKLFYEPKDYKYFLSKTIDTIVPFVDLLAYTLIPNHFHFLIRPNEEIELFLNKRYSSCDDFLTNQFRSLFIGHTKSVNNRLDRHGGLFCRPFRAIDVTDPDYLEHLFYYLHYNHVHHQMGKTLMDYPYSSYSELIAKVPTFLSRELVFELFGGREEFIKKHKQNRNRFNDLPFLIDIE